jgi:hypothetical protein
MMKDRLLDVPERYREGLRRFAQEHVEPGQFLYLVLADWKLNEAIARMDRDVTLQELRALLGFVHNELMPGGCHGSPRAVADWIALAEKCRAGETDCVHKIWYESQPATGATS